MARPGRRAPDAFTRVRVILMNGLENEALRFQHAAARFKGDLHLPLADIRRVASTINSRTSDLGDVGASLVRHSPGALRVTISAWSQPTEPPRTDCAAPCLRAWTGDLAPRFGCRSPVAMSHTASPSANAA